MGVDAFISRIIDARLYTPPVPETSSATASCPPLSGAPLDAASAVLLATRLKAVADPARLRILSLLQAQPNGEACVCHLTGPLDLTQPTVSHHLKVLHDAGLLEREQRGTWAHYRVDSVALGALASVLG